MCAKRRPSAVKHPLCLSTSWLEPGHHKESRKRIMCTSGQSLLALKQIFHGAAAQYINASWPETRREGWLNLCTAIWVEETYSLHSSSIGGVIIPQMRQTHCAHTAAKPSFACRRVRLVQLSSAHAVYANYGRCWAASTYKPTTALHTHSALHMLLLHKTSNTGCCCNAYSQK